MRKNFKYFAWGWALVISIGCIYLLTEPGEVFDIYSLMNLVYSWLVVWYVSEK